MQFDVQADLESEYNARDDYYREAHAGEIATQAAFDTDETPERFCKCTHSEDDHRGGVGSCEYIAQQFGPLGLHCICMTFRVPGQPDPEHCATCGCTAGIGLEEMEACPRFDGCGCHSPF